MMMDINKLYSNGVNGEVYINNVKSSIVKENDEIEIIDLSKEESQIRMDDKLNDYIYKYIKEKDKKDDLAFNKVCSAYLRVEQFVDLDYKSEISICNGLNNALILLALSFINKDDYLITLNEGNSVICNMVKLLQGKVYECELNKFNNYLIDLEDIKEDILKKCKILYLNYPNNPTGAVANKQFYKEIIKYAKKYNFIVINDASYIDTTFDDLDKISFLSVEGAKEIGVEIYDFSKSFNLNELEIGFVAGNKEIIKMFDNLKSKLKINNLCVAENIVIEALNNYEQITNKNKEICLRRYKLFKEIFEKRGFKVNASKATPYMYIEIPKSCNGVNFESAQEFSLWLMENEKIVVSSKGKKHIRLSLNFKDEGEEVDNKFIEEIEKRLNKYNFNN